jgi:hypothetical protein
VKLTTELQLLPRSRKYGSIHPLPHTPSWRLASLVKYRDNFTSLPFSNTWECCKLIIDLEKAETSLLGIASVAMELEE